jgi:trans-2,3-dihydro-3-hydroxyanthranilate isomerase
MQYRYYICDVFSETRFGGNQLAVLPAAEGLTATQMQQIAREFNFSETTFVLPPESGHTRRVRIFTPTAEVPFAGHPNIGTAFVLAKTGEIALGSSTSITFEEKAGLVPITIEHAPGKTIRCELQAPEPLSLGKTVAVGQIADIVSLSNDDIVTATHTPQMASVGLPFVFVELRSRDALERVRVNVNALDVLVAAGIPPDIHLYTHSADEFDIRARMFAPLDGVPEDPATGSATCALVGLLTHYKKARSGSFKWRIAQGVEMGRPSVLDARTRKHEGEVSATWVGGACVMVSEGKIEADC